MQFTSRLQPSQPACVWRQFASNCKAPPVTTGSNYQQLQSYPRKILQKLASRSQMYTVTKKTRNSSKVIREDLINLIRGATLLYVLSTLLGASLLLCDEIVTERAPASSLAPVIVATDSTLTATSGLPPMTKESETSTGKLQSDRIEPTPSSVFHADQEMNTLTASGSNKLKPINFTLVDEVFDSILSDEEVVKRWKNMDSQIQDGIRAILKMVFPQIVSISQDARVSGDCSGGILKWILSLRNLRSWAIKMLDATGKPTAGIFEGSLTMFGNYRQCLSIRAPDEDEIEISEQFEEYFRGQYCVLHLKPWMPAKRPYYNLNSTIEALLRSNYKYYEKTLYDELAEIAIAFNFIDIRMDLCVPSTCTVADIQRVAELLSRKLEMRAKVMRCDIASRELNILNHTDRHIYLWLLVPTCLIIISLIATLLLVILQLKQKSASRQSKDYQGKCKLVAVLDCLSIISTFKDRVSAGIKHQKGIPKTIQKYKDIDIVDDDTDPANANATINTESRSSNLRNLVAFSTKKALPLYSLRSIFVFWFIIIQMTVELKYQYLRESLTLRNMLISYWPFQIIVNSALLFDSIILITAFTYSYACLERRLSSIIGYIFDKYVRLVLSIVTIIAITIVTPLLAVESPVWRNFVEEQSSICKSNGYLNLFFLQNFVTYDKICLPHTWLFCVEMQLIVISIPLLLLLNKTFLSTENSLIIGEKNGKRKSFSSTSLFKVIISSLLFSLGGILSVLTIFIGILLNFVFVYTNQLPPSWFYTFPDVAQKNFYFGQYLTKTWTHLSVFMIGLLGGHICKSIVQLQGLEVSRDNQATQSSTSEQPSPVPSSSTTQSQLGAKQIHGSTSTIMNMEQGQKSKTSDKTTQERQDGALATVSLQIAAIICMIAIIFSTYTWSTQEAPSVIVAATYDALSRFFWSIALVIIMLQLCIPNDRTKEFSRVSQLMSNPVCIMVGRLSFLAYLILPYVHTFILAVEEQPLFPSLFIIFHVIVGNIVITYALAFILAIVIEQPTRRLVSRKYTL